ncbi:hypothetical protein ACFQ0M_28745 [Kitasatospora aburaviensis]
MRRAGYTGFTGDGLQAARAPDDATALPAGGWGYLGAEAAATQGFHPPKRPRPTTGPAAGSGEAYDGTRVDCDRQAAERIGAPPGAGAELIGRLFDESIGATGRDGRVVAATKEWSACMTAAGFRADDPAALAERFRGAPETTPPSWRRPAPTRTAPPASTWPGSGSPCWPATSGSRSSATHRP